MNLNQEKKRIVIFHHYDGIGGAGMTLLYIYKMLCEKFDVIVYVPKQSGDMFNYLTKEGVACKAIGEGIGVINAYSGGPPVWNKNFYLKFAKILKSYSQIKRIIKLENPQLVLLNSITLSWIAKCCSRLSVPVVCCIGETFVNSFFMRLNLRILKRFSIGTTYISQYDMDTFNIQVKYRAVVRNCVIDDVKDRLSRENACKTIGVDPQKFNVLFVGGTRLKVLKGFPTLLKASEYLQNESFNFIVCGEIEEPINRDGFIELGIRTDMPVVYQACDVLVFPSGVPHQARPVFEAGLYEKPVIISNFEQTKEDVVDGHNGLVFEAFNAKELADKIEYYKNNRLALEEMGRNNRAMCIKNHSFESCKEQLLRLVDMIIL